MQPVGSDFSPFPVGESQADMGRLQQAIDALHGQNFMKGDDRVANSVYERPAISRRRMGIGGCICPPFLRYCPPGAVGRANPGLRRARICACGGGGNQVLWICSQLAGKSAYVTSGNDRQVWAGMGRYGQVGKGEWWVVGHFSIRPDIRNSGENGHMVGGDYEFNDGKWKILRMFH